MQFHKAASPRIQPGAALQRDPSPEKRAGGGNELESKLLKGGYIEDSIGVMKGDTRSVDYGSNETLLP